MKTYVVRVNTIDNLYADYMVEANNIIEARNKTEEAFLRDYPDADERVVYSLRNPDNEKIKDIIIAIKESV